MISVSITSALLALTTLSQDSTLADLRERGSVVAHREALAGSGAQGFERVWSDAMFSRDHTALAGYLTQADTLDDAARAAGFYLLKERLQLNTHYAEALQALEASIAADPGQDRADEIALLAIAADQPAMSRTGASGTTLPTRIDRINQLRADVTMAGGAPVPAILDTGAEVNVVMASIAREQGFEFLDGTVNVGTTTAPVEGELAMASRIALGDMVFHDVLFLVLPDEMLTFINGEYTLDMIIGLPVFAAAEQVEWTNQGQGLRLGEHVTRLPDNADSLFWHGSGIGLAARIHGVHRSTHFDSGASRSQLRPDILRHLSDAEQARLEDRSETVTGIGGTETRQAWRASNITLDFGGGPVLFEQVDIIADEENALGDIAMIGNNIIRRSTSFALDFESMRYRVVMAGE